MPRICSCISLLGLKPFSLENSVCEYPFFFYYMQEGENLTREQIEDEIKKIKEAHAEDEGIYVFLTRSRVLFRAFLIIFCLLFV